jgi:hypothetical protein
MCISTPKAPPIPAPPPDPKLTTPKEVGEAAKTAKKNQKSKAKKSLGRSSTVLTGPLGIQDEARTAGKTVLGQ